MSTILTSPQTGATEHSSLLNDAEVDHTPNNAYSNVSVTIIPSLEGQHDLEFHSERWKYNAAILTSLNKDICVLENIGQNAKLYFFTSQVNIKTRGWHRPRNWWKKRRIWPNYSTQPKVNNGVRFCPEFFILQILFLVHQT